MTTPEGEVTADEDRYNPDKLSRIIMLIYGTMEHGGPFWCYVALKPSMFDQFKQAEAAGTLNLYEFDPYGEIIVSGEGKVPPEEVTLKVAEIYQTDPSQFFQPIDPQKVIADKIAQFKAKDQKK